MIMKFMRQKFHLWVFWTLVVVLSVGLVLPGAIGARPEAVAVVGGESIGLDEYNRALSQALESERARLGGELSEADVARLRREALDQIIEEKLALKGLKELGLALSETEIRQTLMADPSFRDEQGNFSLARYHQFLNAQAERGLDYKHIEALIAKNLRLSRGRVFFSNAARVSPAELEQGLQSLHRRARARLLVWDHQTLQASYHPSEDDLRSYYAEHRSRWVKPEQAKARHILIKTDALTGTFNAKARADELYQKAKAGGDFAALAKAHSQDEGSAQRGGDLGWFSKGDMVPEFEAKVWSLKPGEISEPVLSKFGWHIIQLQDKRPGFEPTFDNTRAKVLEEYTLEKARREVRQLSARAAHQLEGGASLEQVAQDTHARLIRTDWFRAGEKALVAGLGDTSPLADELLFLEKGERLLTPVILEKGAALGELSDTRPGETPKDKKQLDADRQKVASRLRNRKAEAMYESWMLSLKAGTKVVDRLEKVVGR